MMEMLDSDVRSALALCIDRGVAAAAVVYPDGCSEFFADPAGESSPESKRFYVAHFNEPSGQASVIPAAISARELLERAAEIGEQPGCTAEFPAESTPWEAYEQGISELVAGFGDEFGKAVIARRIVADSRRHPVDVAEEYFAKSPRTMRAIYYTPRSGVWIVATPEVLLDATTKGGGMECSTMSLAGTRPVSTGEPGPWDMKNEHEHSFVTAHILDAVERLGGSLSGPVERLTLRAGRVEHLCEHIRFGGHFSPPAAIDGLNPTPAVCGYPTGAAMRAIVSLEPPRMCYGGWIGVGEPGRMRAWVNLRSAMSAPGENGTWRYCQFAGGGIVKGSSAADEWREASLKAAPLYECITGSQIPIDHE